MKISIITVAYNSASTIADTLGCVRDQDYPFVEHIVIDGCSSDDTLRIVSAHPHVAQTVSEKDKGIYDAMNKGIRCATGDIIGILNSDDIYAATDALSTVAAAFSDPTVQTVYADLQYVHPDHPGKIVRTWKAGNFNRHNFYYGWMPPHPTFFVRRSVYEELGLFNLELRSAADYELMLRILFKHRVKAHYIPRVLVKMRAGGMSNASLGNRWRANREDHRAWKMNGLNPYFFTVYIKPIRKITQFLIR